MPAASSKPAPQTTPLEGKDTLSQLVGIVEKKIRNLEKRKTKLDGYREMVTSGKVLNKDQEEAVSHFEEVGASLEFAKDLSKQFTIVLAEAQKASKREAKREKQQKHEQKVGKISDVLLLQNVLFHMGQDHVRNDFSAGTNGALHLEEEELTHLDEFFKVVSPTREGQSEEEEEENLSEEEKNFDKKLERATSHLNSYLNVDEKEICNTTYKELFHLVQRIHKCGYLDNIPAPPPEEVVEEMPIVAPAASGSAPSYEQQEEAETTEETYQEVAQEFSEPMSEVQSESYFSGASTADQMQQQQSSAVQAVQTDATPMQSIPTETLPTQQQQHQMGELAAQSRVLDIPQAPEPIEMPPTKQPQHDVNEVLAPVLGNFNFVQDSMLDYDSPHMDPAVVAVSQSFIPSSTFTNNTQSSSNTAEMSQPDQSLGDSLSNQQLQSDQSYQQQTRYDGSQQSYAEQTPYSSQTLEGGSSGFGAQPDMSTTSSVQVEYGSSSQASSTSGKLKDLSEFPSPPVDTQQQLSHTSSQYGSSGLSSTDGFSQSLGAGQLGNDNVTSGLTSQMTQGSSSSPLTITDPSQATIPLPGDQTQSDSQQGSMPTQPKSTMNASAPPFQMTNSMRSSPQMQSMQTSPPGQAQDLGGYQGSMDQDQDYSSDRSGGRIGGTHSPAHDDKLGQTGGPSSDSQGNSYSNYQPYYNKNGRSGKPRGTNANFRGSRGGGPAPFIRGGPRYNAPTQPRGPSNYNTYVQRDTFASRGGGSGGPDISYNPNARYGGFNQVQDQSFYNRRGGMPRSAPRGGRGSQGGPRSQVPYRGGRGSFSKPQVPQMS